MQTITPRFLSALRNSHRVVVQVDAYLDGVLVAARLPITGGSITVDRTSGVRRQLTVQIPDAAILPTLGAALTPYGVELVVQRGIDYGDGTAELVPLGTFRLDVGTTTQANPTSYTGPDRAKALIDARFTGPRQCDAVDAVTMIGTLATEILPDVVVTNVDVTNPEDGSSVLPVVPQVIWDRERWDAMTELAASLGAELYFSASGDLLVAATPSIEGDVVWTVDQGAHGVLVDFSRELSREDTYNGVVASGERADGVYPARAVSLDGDPTSPTRWGGPFGEVPYFYESPLIHTPNGAQRVADALLADKVALSRSVRLSCVPNPALDVGDVIAVRLPNGVDERHLVDRLTIPLDPRAAMTIDTRTPSAVIVIDDPPPPLPPIDVGPPYVPPVLPPYVIPKPPKIPALPSIPGGPTGPYTPGTPAGPGGPGDYPYPGGIPVVPPGVNDPYGKATKAQDQFRIGDAAANHSHWWVRYPGDYTEYDSPGLKPGDKITTLSAVWDPMHRGITGTLFYGVGPNGSVWPSSAHATTRYLAEVPGHPPELITQTTTMQNDPDHGSWISFGDFDTGVPSARPLTYQGTSIITSSNELYAVVPWEPNTLPRWQIQYDSDGTYWDTPGFKPGESVSSVLDATFDPAGRGVSGRMMYLTGSRPVPLWAAGSPTGTHYFVSHFNKGDGGGGIGYNPFFGDFLTYGLWQDYHSWDPTSQPTTYLGTDIVENGTNVVVDTVPVDMTGKPPNGPGTFDYQGNYHFPLSHKPIESKPKPVVWLNDERKLDADEYELDTEHGEVTILDGLSVAPDDLIIVQYTYAGGLPLVDPFPIEIQPLP